MAVEHSDPYETWKAQGRPGGAFADWSKNRSSGATDAPQVQSAPPPTQAPQQKEGKGGAGWNEDFDEQWGRRVLENPQLKERFGLSDYSSLRDEETRRQINKWLRENKSAAEGGATAAPAAAATATPSAATTGAGSEAGVKGPTQPQGTVGKGALVSGADGAGIRPPTRSSALLRPGTVPPAEILWRTTRLPVSGGQLPQQAVPTWPTYPEGGTVKPASAAMQAMALEEQG